MNISEAAKQAGVTAVTLRYYEKQQLIPPVTRKNGGVRDYQQEDMNWIDFIVCMRSSGLSVETLVRYTKLYQEGNHTIDARKNLLIEERQKLIEKHNEIGSTIDKLTRKIEDYDHGKFEIKDVPLKSCD